MKCCGCEKEIDPTKEDKIPPTWFGVYVRSHEYLKVICRECMEKTENKDWYRDVKIP